MNKNIQTVLACIGISVLQVFVFNNVHIKNLITPFIYPLCILLLPFDIQRSMLLIYAFLLGFVMDVFALSGGIHAFTLTFIAFLRTPVIHFISVKGRDKGYKPNIYIQGNQWFLLYFGILFTLHHFLYFSMEIWAFQYMGKTLLRTICSAAVSIAISYILLLGFTKNER